MRLLRKGTLPALGRSWRRRAGQSPGWKPAGANTQGFFRMGPRGTLWGSPERSLTPRFPRLCTVTCNSPDEERNRCAGRRARDAAGERESVASLRPTNAQPGKITGNQGPQGSREWLLTSLPVGLPVSLLAPSNLSPPLQLGPPLSPRPLESLS